MATYLVYQKKVNKKGEAPIYIGFYVNRTKIEVATKISISPDFFDKTKGIIKASYEYAKDKNLIISNIKANINDVFVKYRLRGDELSVNLFWKEYRAHGQYANFFSFCEAYQKMRFQELALATRKKHNSCLNNLKEFSLLRR
jgi:hypothetical protein